MTKLNMLERSILEREEAKEVSKVFSTIVASLLEFESQKIEEWGRDVELSSHTKLKLPLLVRNPETRLLSVNFDAALVRLLREVKYFLLLGLNVPDTALEIYQQVETFRRWTGNMDLIVNMNNDVLNILLPVERPLVQPYLTKFDAVMEKGLSSMNWKSPGITEFIADCMEQVTLVSEVVKTMKDNMRSVNDQLASYSKPLLQRKNKPAIKEEFEREHKNMIKERYSDIKEGGKAIHTMVKETNKVLRVSNASQDWRSYVDFVNNIVIDGLTKVVRNSLEYLLDQIDPAVIAKDDKMPMIEVKLDLVSVRVEDIRRDEVRFIPDLQESGGKGVRDLVNGWVGSFFNVATLFKRLDNEGTYLREIHGDYDVMMLMAAINETLETNEIACMAVKAPYDKHDYLWLTDLQEFFTAFSEEAQYTTPNGQRLLELSKYEEAISKYEGVREIVQQLQSPMDVGWLRFNTQPIKSQLMTWISKWVEMFLSHLKVTLVEKLTVLDGFMALVSKGLDAEVASIEDTKESKPALMRVMGDIRDVRKAMDVTQEMFQPLQEILITIKAHGIDLATLDKIGDKTVQDYLDEAPMQWDGVVKKMFRKKEEILPMQLREVEALKVDLEQFFLSIREFRTQFRANAPFAFEGSTSEAYAIMEAQAVQLEAKEQEARGYNELEELFELQVLPPLSQVIIMPNALCGVGIEHSIGRHTSHSTVSFNCSPLSCPALLCSVLQVSKYPETGDTRGELRLLKTVWDVKALVLFTHDSWNQQVGWPLLFCPQHHNL
jgi:dynein heavy chain, axonemal